LTFRIRAILSDNDSMPDVPWLAPGRFGASILTSDRPRLRQLIKAIVEKSLKRNRRYRTWAWW
jgi:hypothetical protein